MNDSKLPSPEEMRAAIEIIKRFCVEYHGKNEDVLVALGQRLSLEAPTRRTSVEQREATIEIQYFDAITTLLSLARPPNRQTLDRTLARLSDLTSESILDVCVVDVANRGANSHPTLSQTLPVRPRKLTKANTALLEEFESHLAALPGWPEKGAPDQDGDY